ncbi:MAG: hypothetical protein IKV15_09925 [Bacteroidaceae bacterium]|nr:hypothetical protein [Bacteroidaceae bacterium]
MPQIAVILQDEQQNLGDSIRLYAEGIFYKAYERSAWVACRVLHPFMVKKRAVRKVGQEVVSIGFPKTSLDKWAGARRVEHIGNDCVKRVLDFKAYGRYVDDSYVVSNHKGELRELMPYVEAFLKDELGLTLHPDKLVICNVKHGVGFLGRT